MSDVLRYLYPVWRDSLDPNVRWAHCRRSEEHPPHEHTVAFTSETPIERVRCVGTPNLADWYELRRVQRAPAEPEAPLDAALAGDTVRRERPQSRPDPDAEHARSLRPGSQPLPTTSDREGAHDALLRERLSAAVADRKLLGLTRYHTLLQAGNGRDSLRDAVEEALDLSAYLQVWTQARDEALELLSELRAALAGPSHESPAVERLRRAENIATIRKIEHLLGGGTSD